MNEPLPKLMDCRAIIDELGIRKSSAEAIIRELAKTRFVASTSPRKTWVYREDVEAWVKRQTRSAA